MTDAELNTAIAQACPHLFSQGPYGDWAWLKNGTEWERCVNGSICHDLNAMHKAESTLGALQQLRFASIIAEQVKSRHWDHLGFDCLHSAARQRAEAFCQVIDIQRRRKQV